MPVTDRNVSMDTVPQRVREMLDETGLDTMKGFSMNCVKDPFPPEVHESGLFPVSRMIASKTGVSEIAYTHNLEQCRDLDFQGVGVRFYKKRDPNKPAHILFFADWDNTASYISF